MVQLFAEYGISQNNAGFAELENKLINRFGEKMRKKIIDINFNNEKSYYSGYIRHEKIIKVLYYTNEVGNVYIWTSNDKRTIMPVLNDLSIVNLCSTIVTRNDVQLIKPSGEGFDLINKDNKPAGDFLFIGDSDADKNAALSLGIDFIHVSEFED